MLHITNGDSAGESLRETGLGGEVLTWNDILHEGPTPAGLSLDQMSKIRARFLANWYTLSYTRVQRDFTRRDTMLARFHTHEEVILWFEHDLYDQLQIIQLLDWFAQQKQQTKLSMICINAFPGIEPFRGLGQLTPEQLASLFGSRQPVTTAMLNLGRTAWQAFCSPDPRALEAIRKTDTSVLPFLDSALLRYIEEFPSLQNGLSRTERQLLEVVISGKQQPVDIFHGIMEKEEHSFMGDTTCWKHLEELCQGSRPLLKRADGGTFTLPRTSKLSKTFLRQSLIPTAEGEAVLGGKADWIRLSGRIDRWLGGVHLQGDDAAWRWNGQALVSSGMH